MNNLIIKSTEEEDYTSPDVYFNAETGICLITGVSFMESSDDFYRPVLKWIKSYISNNDSLNLIFKLSYYNTSSSKIFFDLLIILNNFKEKGGELLIEWHFDEWDNDLEDDIIGLMTDTNTDIKIVKLNP